MIFTLSEENDIFFSVLYTKKNQKKHNQIDKAVQLL